MAALKLSLQPRPLMMRGRGLWKGTSPFSVTSATAVWRLSSELDFFRPSDGPTSLVEEPDGGIQVKQISSSYSRFTLSSNTQLDLCCSFLTA